MPYPLYLSCSDLGITKSWFLIRLHLALLSAFVKFVTQFSVITFSKSCSKDLKQQLSTLYAWLGNVPVYLSIYHALSHCRFLHNIVLELLHVCTSPPKHTLVRGLLGHMDGIKGRPIAQNHWLVLGFRVRIQNVARNSYICIQGVEKNLSREGTYLLCRVRNVSGLFLPSNKQWHTDIYK